MYSSGQGEEATKRKRRRLALSCVECKSRKIKCDRNVPNCSSCLARGIQRNCRWGDERDADDRMFSQQTPISPESDVDRVVEKVLKRLQGREAPISPPATTSSSPSVNSAIAHPVHAAANIVKTTAFLPSKINPLDGRFSWPKPKDAPIDVQRVRTSLKALPTRAAVERLLQLYLAELEPFRSAFNVVILRQQLDEFWQGVDELDIQGQCLIWPGEERISHRDPIFPRQEAEIDSSNVTPLLLTGIARQGLIALTFSLLYATLSSLDYARKMKMGIFPASMTEKDVEIWSNEFHHLSRLHLDLSDYIERPTIWSIQVLFLQSVYHMDHRSIRRSQVNLSIILRLCVSLGLNRLGSAIDDARAIQEDYTKSKPAQTAATEAEADGRANVTSNSFGVIISSFEEGNIALRELGRKLWTMLVSADFTMGAHMDSFFSVHDNINHTSPPCAINDEELMSASAPFLLLSRRSDAMFSPNAFPACWQAISRAGRLQVELENTKGSPLSYRDVLRVDREFQAAINSFPPFYLYKSSTLRGDSMSRPIVIQRNVLHEQAQFRLLRLHRLHLGKGFRDPQYLHSLQACFDASKVILDASIEMEKVVTHSRRMIGYQIHCLHSALVTHLILMFEVDQREEERQSGKPRPKNIYRLEDIEGAMDQLQMGINILRSHSSSSKEWPKGLDKMESFLQRVKSDKTILNGASEEKQPIPLHSFQSPRLAAADILASIPSSNLNSTSLLDPTLSTGDIWSNDADLWSLNALFPDYATNSIDLVDALERVVWSS